MTNPSRSKGKMVVQLVCHPEQAFLGAARDLRITTSSSSCVLNSLPTYEFLADANPAAKPRREDSKCQEEPQDPQLDSGL